MLALLMGLGQDFEKLLTDSDRLALMTNHLATLLVLVRDFLRNH